MYKSLADAAFATDDPRYGHGPMGIFYARQPTWDTNVKLSELADTHAYLGQFDSTDHEEAYEAMQGEVWSPHGEARDFIRGLGLRHTSMSTGDVIEIDGRFFICASVGFFEMKP